MTNLTLSQKISNRVSIMRGINPKRTGIVGKAAGIKSVVICPKCCNDRTKLIDQIRIGRHYCRVCGHEFGRHESL